MESIIKATQDLQAHALFLRNKFGGKMLDPIELCLAIETVINSDRILMNEVKKGMVLHPYKAREMQKEGNKLTTEDQKPITVMSKM